MLMMMKLMIAMLFFLMGPRKMKLIRIMRWMAWSRFKQPNNMKTLRCMRIQNMGMKEQKQEQDGLKKACCGTVVNVTDLCWPVLFPSQPNIRFMLKSICTKPNLH
ncbi:hypothetical protein HID58_025036 [Brassica napus]|uniref:Prolamin-like domain-containing protein n=1 Tax=Brassica napus TaxID=3708 RepID=A0ABQ8CLZ9_BRANA|nr:hypothetical protein HID58_025036 [Brassica napus]